MTSGFTHKKVRVQQTLSEKLIHARKKLGYNLDYIEKETKISMKYLLEIERGNFDSLPANVYVIGFLERLSQILNLNYQEIISQFKKESQLDSTIKKGQKKDSSNVLKPNLQEKWIQQSKFVVTPKLILSSLVILLVVGILSYIWFQVKGFASAPPLKLDTNETQQVVKVESIILSGQTDPSADLKINNEQVAVDENGGFIQKIKLDEGVNNIEISAKNKANKETKKIIKILAEY